MGIRSSSVEECDFVPTVQGVLDHMGPDEPGAAQHQDLRQRAELGVALVHGNRSQAERTLDQIHRMFEEQPEAQLLNWDDDYIEDFDE